jgi:energy-coupling factor transport system ATP-binding protein
VIKLQNVSYTFPFADNPALKNVSLTVHPGEVILCTGVSGCGKTTLMRVVNGLAPHYFGGTLTGSVTVAGKENTGRSLAEISKDVGTLFQDPENQFFALGVEDEMRFVADWEGEDPAEVARKVARQSERFGLKDVLSSSIHELSQGQKQKLGLSTITMNPVKALILDEPTANLDPEATEELAREIQKLKAEGCAVLIVDHRLYWLEGIADRVLVFKDGEIAEEGDFGILTDAVRARYGLRRTRVADTRGTLRDAADDLGKGNSLLSFAGMRFAHRGRAPLYENAALALTPGISAVIGRNGAGKTTLARILTGLNKAETGEFYLRGAKVRQKDLLKHVAIVLQNADHQLHMRSVLSEVATSLKVAGAEGGDKAALELLALFDLAHLAHRHPQSLSGGEKQRLVIACAFAKDPDIILLDEPTSGLDGVNMRRIADALNLQASRGKCVLVITHDLELMELCCTKAVRLPLQNSAD